MQTIYNKTPLLKQNFQWGKIKGPQIYVKYENLQPSGSFKLRGISNLILTKSKALDSKRKPHIFSSSGGNAGLAAATASNLLKYPCTVVVPETTKVSMIRKIEKVGAKVIIQGKHWQEADDYLTKDLIANLESDIEPIYVHPFDDPLIWDGHSTLVDEIVESGIDMSKVKGIVCSVGGGGLYNGIMTGLIRHNLVEKIPVVAMETIGCDSLNKSIRDGEHIKLNSITSVATSLGATKVSEKTYEFATAYRSYSYALNDIDVLKTCIKYSDDFKMIIEPACGASLHMAYNTDLLEKLMDQKFDENDIFIVVQCGGSASTLKELEEAYAKVQKA